MTNILSTSFNTLYVFAGMVLLEFIIFLIMVTRKNLNVLRVFFAALSGNAFTTVLCLFVPAGNSDFGYYTWFGISFLLAVVFEWLIDVAYFKDRPNTLSNSRFLWISIICNIVSFGAIFALKHYELIG